MKSKLPKIAPPKMVTQMWGNTWRVVVLHGPKYNWHLELFQGKPEWSQAQTIDEWNKLMRPTPKAKKK